MLQPFSWRNGRYDESLVYMEKVLQAKGDTHFDFRSLAVIETDADTRQVCKSWTACWLAI